MSLGNWDHFYTRFSYELEEFCSDIKKHFPKLSDKLLQTGKALSEIILDIDYDVFGDEAIKSNRDFENEALSKLGRASI